MNKSIQEIITELDSFSDAADSDQLGKLDDALNDIELTENPLLFIEPLLRIFERFSGTDGSGVFWTILHKIEAMPGYERLLLKSIQHRPSEFGLLMINRVLNDNQPEIEGVNLISLLTNIETRVDSGGVRLDY